MRCKREEGGPESEREEARTKSEDGVMSSETEEKAVVFPRGLADRTGTFYMDSEDTSMSFLGLP